MKMYKNLPLHLPYMDNIIIIFISLIINILVYIMRGYDIDIIDYIEMIPSIVLCYVIISYIWKFYYNNALEKLSLLDKIFMNYMKKLDSMELEEFGLWIQNNVRFVTNIPIEQYNLDFECKCKGMKTLFYPYETDSKYLHISTNKESIEITLERNIEYLPYFKFDGDKSYKIYIPSLSILFLLWITHMEDDKTIYITLPDKILNIDIGDFSKTKTNFNQIQHADSNVIQTLKTHKERMQILTELENEKHMLQEKINDAKSAGNNKAIYALMRADSELTEAISKAYENQTFDCDNLSDESGENLS